MENELLLGDILKAKKLTIATAESFTGGLFGKKITDIPGSSEYFLGGIIAYSYKAKEKLLKVNKRTLAKYGAVSAETAKEMATNVKNILNADIGVSFTGVAGPSLQEGKPAGLVYIGISYNNTLVFKEKFGGSRIEIREKSVDFAIEKLINLIGGKT
ncbi:MAG: CinA family protein [Caldisericaceae bacterium]|nr:CinA family protein [Caldisericaceae bacterium]